MVKDEERGKILDPNGPLPKKRKHIYCMHPNVYEIGECVKCDGRNITWSEYVDYMWCYDCNIDYIPEHFGMFDGPIPMGLSEIMGIKFDRVNLKTGKRYKPDDPEFNTTWP